MRGQSSRGRPWKSKLKGWDARRREGRAGKVAEVLRDVLLNLSRGRTVAGESLLGSCGLLLLVSEVEDVLKFNVLRRCLIVPSSLIVFRFARTLPAWSFSQSCQKQAFSHEFSVRLFYLESLHDPVHQKIIKFGSKLLDSRLSSFSIPSSAKAPYYHSAERQLSHTLLYYRLREEERGEGKQHLICSLNQARIVDSI